MGKHRTWAVWLTLTISLLALPGCWDYQSISARAALVGLGIDSVDNDPAKVRITVQYPLLSHADSATQGGPSQGGTTQMYKNLTADGYSLSDVLRQIQLRMDKNMDTTQLRCIVFSQKLAPKAMDAVVGELIRESKINRLAYVASTPNSAMDVLKVNLPEGAPMDVLDKTFSHSVRQHGFYVRKQLWEYWRDTVQYGKIPVIPNVYPASSIDGENDALRVEGLTVYQRNRPTIRLSRQETLNVNLLNGMVRNMGINIPSQKGIIALTDVRAHSRLRTRGPASRLHIIDEVSVRATVSKVGGVYAQSPNRTDLNQMEAQTSAYLTKRLQVTMAKLQRQGADIFGFGAIYMQHHPDQARVVRYQWGDVFRHAIPEVQVKVRISSKGMLI